MGQDGRDEDLEDVIERIQMAGRVGFAVMTWNFTALRASEGYAAQEGVGRGGAHLRDFDHARIRDLPPLDDEAIGLASSDLVGEVALVNVFASWCLPCRVEHPLLMELAVTGKVALHGVNYKDKTEDARAWLDELGDPFLRIGADRDGRVGIDLGVYGVPETFVVDRTGRIRYKHVGPISQSDLEKYLLPLVEKLRQ